MRHKISKFSLIIFLFSSNFKLFGNPCDEFGCLCCCNDKIENDKIEAALMEKLNEKYSKNVENININVLMDDLKDFCFRIKVIKCDMFRAIRSCQNSVGRFCVCNFTVKEQCASYSLKRQCCEQ